MPITLFQQCLLVGAGGCLGAIARFLVGTWITGRWGSAFPWATFVINVTGSFVLGLFATLILHRILLHPAWRLFVTVGFVGAYTTFSTYEYETAQLGVSWPALGNLLGSVAGGYLAVWLGIRLGALWHV